MTLSLSLSLSHSPPFSHETVNYVKWGSCSGEIFGKDQMREIEKMLTKNFLENFYWQKHLEEETLMQMFGRDIVLQMSKRYTLSSQEPNSANETGFKAPTVLHKGVQLTLGGPSLDQDRREERLRIHNEGSLPSQLHPGGKENTNPKMLFNFTPSQHQKERNVNSSEDPAVLHMGAQMPLMGGGSSFVSDTQGRPSLNDQDRREERHGIHEEGDLPFQLHADRKENTKPKMLLDYSMSSQQPKATNKISEKAPAVLHKGVQMTLVNSSKKCSPETKANADTPLVDGNETKKEKWECQLCHVMTDTKEVLEQHYKGKKHKKKEKAARESSNISLAIKESFKENMESRLEDDFDKLGSGPSVLEKDEIITNEDAFGTKRKIAPAEEEQGNEIASSSHQNKKTKFWCQGCKFGTYTEATMLNHRMGMEHMELMQMTGGAVTVEINGPGDFHYGEAGNDAN